MFKPQSFLINDVQSGDLERIQDGLSSYLTKNPSDENLEVTNAIKYVEQNFSGEVWEEHDGRHLESDSTKWNREYLGLLKSDLRSNFSRRRFNHILEVGKVVFPAKKKTSTTITTTSTTPTQQRPRVQQTQQDGVKVAPWMVIAGAVIVTAALVMFFRK